MVAVSQQASFNAWLKHEIDAYAKQQLCGDVLVEMVDINSTEGLPEHRKSSQVIG